MGRVEHDAIGIDFVPTAAEMVASVELDGEAVLYDESTHRLHVLNPAATIIWRCCDGSGTAADIANDIADAFRADRGAVEADVLATIREFGRKGLLAGIAGDDYDIEEPLLPGEQVS